MRSSSPCYYIPVQATRPDMSSVLNILPDVQKKAQAEIDAVIGNDRLPRLSDREHLPYVCAVVTEVLRWHNVAPTGAAIFASSLFSLFSVNSYHRCPSHCNGRRCNQRLFHSQGLDSHREPLVRSFDTTTHTCANVPV